jgi:hypothetical protein
VRQSTKEEEEALLPGGADDLLGLLRGVSLSPLTADLSGVRFKFELGSILRISVGRKLSEKNLNRSQRKVLKISLQISVYIFKFANICLHI